MLGHRVVGMRHAGAVARVAVCALAAAPVAGQSAPSVRDSSGVRIVRYKALPKRTAYTVGPPTYRVGWSPSSHQFGLVVSGVLLSDGEAAVGDAMSSQLVMIGPKGRVRVILGGHGQGPREIGSLASVSLMPGDTVAVEDDGNGRMSYYFDDKFVRDQRFDDPVMAWGLGVLGFQGGAFVLDTYSVRQDFTEPWFRGSFVRHIMGSHQWDTIASYDLAHRFAAGPLDPFRPSGDAALTQSAVLSVRSDLSQVTETSLSTGQETIIRWSEKPPEFTDSLWNLYVEIAKDRHLTPSQWGARARSAVKQPLPTVGKVEGDALGRAWVAAWTPDFWHPSRYRLFGRDGKWLGWVRLPPRFQVLDITSHSILGIQLDSMDVQAIEVLPLIPEVARRSRGP